MDKSRLTEELRSAGASEHELGGLADLAQSLKPLGAITRAEETKRIRLQRLQPAREVPRWRFALGPALALSLVALIGTVSGAAASTPGDPLYPVKLLTERAAVTINPGLKSQVVIERSQDVIDATKKANAATVVNTANELRSEVGMSLDPVTAAKVIGNLEQAQAHLQDGAHDELTKTLQDIEEKVSPEKPPRPTVIPQNIGGEK